MNKINTPPIRPTLRGLVLALAVAGGIFATTGISRAQTQIYSETFDIDSTPNWITNAVGLGWSFANFYFDYSTLGIPSAPHSVGGTTRGMKLVANLGVGGTFPAAITVCPTNFGITDNFEMRFDMWMNYDKSGNGSTEIAGAGYGTAGTSAQAAGGTFDSVTIGLSTDGGTTADYRVYAPAFPGAYQDPDRTIAGDFNSPSVYACSNRNNTATYYTSFLPAVRCPQAQTNLFPRQTGLLGVAGTIAFAWHDISLKKVGNIITYSIDGHLIATANATQVGTLGGTNILFTMYDTGTGGCTDVDGTNVLFALYDNVRITNFPTVVTIQATTPNASPAGPVQGVFTLTRTSAGAPLTVNYTMSGTAAQGTQYSLLPVSAASGSVTFSALATTTNITVNPLANPVPSLTQTAIMTVNSVAGSYTAGGSDTVYIANTNTSVLTIVNISSQMYERTNDLAKFRISRLGDTSVALPQINVTYGGTASPVTQFYGAATANMNPGDVSVDVFAYPIHDGLVTGPLTVTATVAPAGDGSYNVGSPATSGAVTRVDADDPTETVIWSDNLQADTSANWTQFFAEAPDPTFLDAVVDWAYDYTALAVPPAPHSGADTHGLHMTVNKLDAIAAAAALNFYPNGQTFSGNYALRFDMFLIRNDTSGQTEYALFGLNHSGTKTNWFRNSTTTFTGVDAAGWNFDGVFYDVESDGAALGDYVAYSSPTTAGNNPTPLLPPPTSGRNASTLEAVFKTPPWTATAGSGGTPANVYGSSTPIWADVELAQVNGVIYWSINHTLIFAYTNATAYTGGNIMLGYEDAYDSIGATGGSVIYANARVISLQSPLITNIVVNGSNVEITFTANAGDVVGQFALQQSSPLVTGPYADTGATITSLGGGVFKAVKPIGANPTFYRIRRIY